MTIFLKNHRWIKYLVEVRDRPTYEWAAIETRSVHTTTLKKMPCAELGFGVKGGCLRLSLCLLPSPRGWLVT